MGAISLHFFLIFLKSAKKIALEKQGQMRGKFNLRMHYSIFVYNVQDYFQIFSYFLILS